MTGLRHTPQVAKDRNGRASLRGRTGRDMDHGPGERRRLVRIHRRDGQGRLDALQRLQGPAGIAPEVRQPGLKRIDLRQVCQAAIHIERLQRGCHGVRLVPPALGLVGQRQPDEAVARTREMGQIPLLHHE